MEIGDAKHGEEKKEMEANESCLPSAENSSNPTSVALPGGAEGADKKRLFE